MKKKKIMKTYKIILFLIILFTNASEDKYQENIKKQLQLRAQAIKQREQERIDFEQKKIARKQAAAARKIQRNFRKYVLKKYPKHTIFKNLFNNLDNMQDLNELLIAWKKIKNSFSTAQKNDQEALEILANKLFTRSFDIKIFFKEFFELKNLRNDIIKMLDKNQFMIIEPPASSLDQSDQLKDIFMVELLIKENLLKNQVDLTEAINYLQKLKRQEIRKKLKTRLNKSIENKISKLDNQAIDLIFKSSFDQETLFSLLNDPETTSETIKDLFII